MAAYQMLVYVFINENVHPLSKNDGLDGHFDSLFKTLLNLFKTKDVPLEIPNCYF